ncbi:GDSL-type esterase/lipase family protein [Marivita sp. GX14005]|uniref:GDSL-type esterase/lipase family protein n=1 Tax=Marivita sp. GX14005 TaxID=2942276 RepID=UPI002019080D|nr:GDSL-type esterase/lipase family protein [Marivita sp. GX14005]MCL3882683.1 GDSL-type esterase/lipase family protein [Marivita sp. GX14005]
MADERPRPAPIPVDELRRMLFDIDVPEEDCAAYMLVDPAHSRAFDPAVRVNPALLQPPAVGSGLDTALQGAIALGGLNGISRWRRNRRYRSRIAGGWNGLKLVSEGDSWFQFPFLLTDVIDHLSEEHAILSLGAAGDTLDDLIAQDEVVAAVMAEAPDAVLLSGGGNDLVGGGNLAAIVRPFDPALDAAGHITPALTAVLSAVIGHVRSIATAVSAAAPTTPVLIHTYDHAIPDNGKWLGRPLASQGIVDRGLQREIVRILIDRWAEALAALAREPGLAGTLHVVDCRGTVPEGGWHDELHPESGPYGTVAAKFQSVIQAVTAPQPVAALGALGTGRAVSRRDPLPATIQDLADRFDDSVLLSEIGRRASLERIQPAGVMMAPRDPGGVPSSSLEGGYPALSQLGQRILARAHRELHRLLCGDDEADKADRQSLRDAFNIGQGATAAALAGLLAGGPLGLSAFVAAPVAALILRRFLAPSWEETCKAWGDMLDTGGSVQASLDTAQRGLAAARRNPDRFCIAFKKAPSAADAEAMANSKAAVLESAKWPFNSVIRIRFLEGSDHLKERVQHHARAWIAEDMAALTFEFIDSGDADIRIAFIPGAGSWSLLGTDCRNETDQSKPTMNFGWLDDSSSEEEIREVVLHEFGHALGLIHEHQNPDGGIEWDEAAVAADLTGPPNFWDKDTIRRNVLDHYDPGKLIATQIDPLSIMMYPIPDKWTKGDFQTSLNSQLSPTDRALIRQVYPSI